MIEKKGNINGDFLGGFVTGLWRGWNFIRRAVKSDRRKRECEAIRKAYLRSPNSAEDGDDWANAVEWEG